jgi:PmbA protein
MTIEEIIKTVQKLPGVSAWEFHREHKKSYQRFLVFDKIESQRLVEKSICQVSLYVPYEFKGQKVLGESTISLVEGENIKEQLLWALEMATIVANPVFDLPDKKSLYDLIDTADPKIRINPWSCLDHIQDEFLKEKVGKIKRGSAEFFIEDIDLFFLNSKGLEIESSETKILIDFVLLAKKDNRLIGESQGMTKGRFCEDLGLSEMVSKYSQYAIETLEAQLPKAGVYPVVFSEEALDTLFNFYCYQASGPAQFRHSTCLTLGEPVIKDLIGEPMTLLSNPGLKGGIKSRAFDDNGLPLHRVEVIQNNFFQKRMNNKRYADYLEEEATGDFTNIEIATGSKSMESLLKETPCYHLLRFSNFEPNLITGGFSGEIRTGYFVKGEQRVPIKGGSVSGVMQEAFKEAFFSLESTKRNAYQGPMAVRIEKLSIAGS